MHLLQASSRIVVACLVWTMLLGGTVSPLGYLAQAGQPPPDWEQPPPEEEPWAGVPGEESDKGVEFETPFIMGISSLAVEVTDCTTGAPIPAASLQAEFVFREGTEEPYSPEDLVLIVVWAPGYFPQVVTEFSVVEIPMGFIALKIIVAAPICLLPLNEEIEGVGYFLPGQDLELDIPPPVPQEALPQEPRITPPPPPSPPPVDPSQCGAYEVEQRAYRAVYAYVPGGVTVDCHEKPNGALETTFTFQVRRTVYWKARTRGPCTREADHSGLHRPWRWSDWEDNGTTVDTVTMTKTIGGCPTGMSASYFKRWLIAFGYADLAANHRIDPRLNLGRLRYVETGYDPRPFYESDIKPLLEQNRP